MSPQRISLCHVYSRHHLQRFESPTRRGVSESVIARCPHSRVRNQGVRGILRASKLGRQRGLMRMRRMKLNYSLNELYLSQSQWQRAQLPAPALCWLKSRSRAIVAKFQNKNMASRVHTLNDLGVASSQGTISFFVLHPPYFPRPPFSQPTPSYSASTRTQARDMIPTRLLAAATTAGRLRPPLVRLSSSSSAVPAEAKPIPAVASQAPNRATTWSTNQRARPAGQSGPRFEQTFMELQPNPLSAMELVANEPIRLVHGRKVVCDGGKSA